MTKNAVKTLSWLCAALVVVLVPGLAGAQNLVAVSDASGTGGNGITGGEDVLWNQANACGGGSPASQQFPDFGDAVLQSADDFMVPDDVEWTLSDVIAGGVFFGANPNNGPLNDVVVQIWSDEPGLPGELLCEDFGANLLAPGPDMALELDDCAGPWGPGDYWVSVMGYMPFSPSGQVAWAANDSTNGNEFAFQDPDMLLGPGPCNSWGSGITTCGIGASFPDLCFIIEGTESPLQTVTEIPTLGQVGLVVLLLSLLGAGFYRLRRK